MEAVVVLILAVLVVNTAAMIALLFKPTQTVTIKEPALPPAPPLPAPITAKERMLTAHMGTGALSPKAGFKL